MFTEYEVDKEKLDKYIKQCKNNGHLQQVVYNVDRDLTTQICFVCQKVRHTKLN